MSTQEMPTISSVQNNLYFGDIFMSMLYGFHICAGIQSVYFLVLSRKSMRHKVFYISFTVLQTAAFTVSLIQQYLSAEETWLHVSQTLSLLTFSQELSSVVGKPYNMAALVISMAANFIADALLLYRCFKVWSSQRLVMAVPSVLLLAIAALGLAITAYCGAPAGFSFDAKTMLTLLSVYSTVSVTFNIFITSLIVFRLWYMEHSILEIDDTLPLGSKKIVRQASAILIESALPFTISGIWFLVTSWPISTSGRDQTKWIARGLWAGFSFLSPQLIILRVSMDCAMSNKFPVSPSSVHFVGPPLDLEALGEQSNDSDSLATSSEISAPKNNIPVLVQEKK